MNFIDIEQLKRPHFFQILLHYYSPADVIGSVLWKIISYSKMLFKILPKK